MNITKKDLLATYNKFIHVLKNWRLHNRNNNDIWDIFNYLE